jgi:hypothetical protein
VEVLALIPASLQYALSRLPMPKKKVLLEITDFEYLHTYPDTLLLFHEVKDSSTVTDQLRAHFAL